jgi:hypothetical protein
MSTSFDAPAIIVAATFAGFAVAISPAAAQSFGQPYPCAIQVSGNSTDCKVFGLGGEIDGCIKVDGFVSNDGAEELKQIMVTILVDKHVIVNMTALPLTGAVKPGENAPYSGATKFEITQALMLNARMYTDRPDTQCLITPIR